MTDTDIDEIKKELLKTALAERIQDNSFNTSVEEKHWDKEKFSAASVQKIVDATNISDVVYIHEQRMNRKLDQFVNRNDNGHIRDSFELKPDEQLSTAARFLATAFINFDMNSVQKMEHKDNPITVFMEQIDGKTYDLIVSKLQGGKTTQITQDQFFDQLLARVVNPAFTDRGYNNPDTKRNWKSLMSDMEKYLKKPINTSTLDALAEPLQILRTKLKKFHEGNMTGISNMFLKTANHLSPKQKSPSSNK